MAKAEVVFDGLEASELVALAKAGGKADALNSGADMGMLKEAEAKVKASLAQMSKQIKAGMTTLVGDLVVEKINQPVLMEQAA